MPRHVIDDAWVTLNSVDMSGRVKKVTLMLGKRPPQEVTAFQDTYEERVNVHVRKWRVSLELYQDYSTGSVYETLKGINNSTASSGVPIIIRPTTNARSTGNPEFSGSVLLDGDFALIDAAVGDVNMSPVSFMGNGTLSMVTTSS